MARLTEKIEVVMTGDGVELLRDGLRELGDRLDAHGELLRKIEERIEQAEGAAPAALEHRMASVERGLRAIDQGWPSSPAARRLNRVEARVSGLADRIDVLDDGARERPGADDMTDRADTRPAEAEGELPPPAPPAETAQALLPAIRRARRIDGAVSSPLQRQLALCELLAGRLVRHYEIECEREADAGEADAGAARAAEAAMRALNAGCPGLEQLRQACARLAVLADAEIARRKGLAAENFAASAASAAAHRGQDNG